MRVGQMTGPDFGRTMTLWLSGALIVALSLIMAQAPRGSGFYALGSVLLFAVMVRFPVMGLAALCSLLSVEGISGQGMHVTEIHLAGIVAFGAWIIHLFLYGRALRVNRPFNLALLFVVWAGISILWAMDKESAGEHYVTLIELLMLFLLTINVVETRRDLAIVLGSILLGGLATCGTAINLFTENLMERARVFEAQNANGYAAAVGLGLLSGLYFTGKGHPWWLRVTGFLGIGFLTVPLVLAQSRSAWLATITAMIVFIWHSRNRWRNFLLIAATGAVLWSVIYYSGLVNYSVVTRAMDVVKVRERGSDRFDIWQAGAGMFLDHPLAGVGFNQFPRQFNSYRAMTPGIRHDMFSNRDPHSMYVGVTTELGLAGITLLLILVWSIWREGQSASRESRWFGRALVAFFMVFGLTGTVIWSKIFWLGLGLASRSLTLSGNPGGQEMKAE